MTAEYLMDRELEHVFAALTPSNALVMRVCLHTGLRLGDVLELKTDQLKSRFCVTEMKTEKRRIVGLPGWLLDELRRQAGPVYVFPHRSGDPNRHRTRQAVWRDVKRAATAFRLPQNVSPHSVRKVYAVRLREQYGDLEKVRRALNHDNLATTMVYAMAGELLTAKHLRQVNNGCPAAKKPGVAYAELTRRRRTPLHKKGIPN